ncbi:helix-turn-helix domain-containing protein [Arsenicicoccus bolidensis]|uniref:Helix-turn-helix domain-containing protein n=1 Tax=Arsenicicoccus bolidensis TaxID=229480 RepID=A0ABS9Q1H6_9MICO|nr:metalloregulator ArsR/SmtB family transcription factor [Arsenicicoccus bolidensis]MCG7321708.1 helix-turn-helix domain-containing protein [Arsenicicoccus bolidensis]
MTQAPAGAASADAATDRVLRALADSTRRDIVSRTLAAPCSVSELARDYPMSFAAVQKHVAALQSAGLVTKTRRGREQLVSAEVQTLRTARAALEALEETWRGRIDRMGEILAHDAQDAHAQHAPHDSKESS